MTVTEAAVSLGVSQQRVRALIAAGRLATKQTGRAHDIDPAALEAVRVRPTGRPAGKKDSRPRKKMMKSITLQAG